MANLHFKRDLLFINDRSTIFTVTGSRNTERDRDLVDLFANISSSGADRVIREKTITRNIDYERSFTSMTGTSQSVENLSHGPRIYLINKTTMQLAR